MQYGSKRSLLCSLGILLVGILTSCGSNQKTVDATTISFTREGVVESTIVEEFNKDYYTTQELTSMIEEEIDAYNETNNAQTIALKEITQREDKEGYINVCMEYSSAEAYRGFNGVFLFYGTVEEAYTAGYDLNLTLCDASDPTKTIGKSALLGMGDHHIMIIAEPLQVQLRSKALYLSDQAELLSNRLVQTADGDSYTYIITK